MAVGTPTTSSGGSATPSVSVPAGVASGDIVVLALSVDNSSSAFSAAWPAGFTNLDDRSLTFDGERVGVAWKRLTGADSGSYTMGNIGAGGGNYGMAAIPLTGRHATNPPVLGTVTVNNTANANPVTVTAPGVTAVAGDDILWCSLPDVNAANIGNGHTAPTGYTEIVDLIDAGSGWANIGAAKLENVSAGATGNIAGTLALSSGASGWASFLVRIPVAPGGATPVDLGTVTAATAFTATSTATAATAVTPAPSSAVFAAAAAATAATSVVPATATAVFSAAATVTTAAPVDLGTVSSAAVFAAAAATTATTAVLPTAATTVFSTAGAVTAAPVVAGSAAASFSASAAAVSPTDVGAAAASTVFGVSAVVTTPGTPTASSRLPLAGVGT